MSPYQKEITRLCFEGPRFEDHGIDFDVLPDLFAYKKLLVDTAIGLWWARHPDRERIDRGFESAIRLKFFTIETGSATVPILRVWDNGGDETALRPEVMRVVFRDSGFADDVVKTNTVRILLRAGIDDMKSL